MESNLFLGEHNPAPHQQFFKAACYFRTGSEKEQIHFLKVLLNIEKLPKMESVLVFWLITSPLTPLPSPACRTHICHPKYNIYKSTTSPSQSQRSGLMGKDQEKSLFLVFPCKSFALLVTSTAQCSFIIYLMH